MAVAVLLAHCKLVVCSAVH